MFPDYGLTESFSSAFEGDLAGNAFNSVDFVVAFLALMSALAESSNFNEVVRAPPKDEELQPTPRWIADLFESSQLEKHVVASAALVSGQSPA